MWTDDGHAMPKAAAFVVATALLAAVPLIAPPLFHVPNPRVISPMTLVVTLLPQAFALSLPASLLIAIPLAFRRIQIGGRLIRRTLLLSTAVVAANYVVVAHMVPDANQSFREAVARALPNAHVTLSRGPAETPLSDLRRQIDDLKRTPGSEAFGRRLEYDYQLRLAIVAAAIPLAVAGLVVAVPRRSSRRLLLAVGVLVAYWALMACGEAIVKAPTDIFVPEYLCAWAPNAILLIACCATLGVWHRRNRLSAVARA
jgi:lipopolysaccharide export LptBFGC system permease protein LptF